MKLTYDTNWMSTVGKNIINEVVSIAAFHLAAKLAKIKPSNPFFCSNMTFDATGRCKLFAVIDRKMGGVV